MGAVAEGHVARQAGSPIELLSFPRAVAPYPWCRNASMQPRNSRTLIPVVRLRDRCPRAKCAEVEDGRQVHVARAAPRWAC